LSDGKLAASSSSRPNVPVILPPISSSKASVRQVHHKLLGWELDDRVPRSVKQRQKEDIEELFQCKMVDLQKEVNQALATAVPENTPIINIQGCDSVKSFFPEILSTIEKEHAFSKKNLELVEPVTLHLGESTVKVTITDSDTVEVVSSVDDCIIFPFAKQLQAVLSQCELYDAMQRFRKQFRDNPNKDGRIRSHFDGEEWQKHPFFVKHPGAYAIEFYYDDVTITNPIGHYKRKICAPRVYHGWGLTHIVLV
jgi:hypothetical protein